MKFTIVTPSFKQLDYLECCIASVADQGTKGSENVGMCESGNVRGPESLGERLSVEHIVQDAGSPGIEEFARGIERRLSKKYGGNGSPNLAAGELLHWRTSGGYSLRIFKERDAGMYDAVNRGLEKGSGNIGAYLNCDEQYLPRTLEWVQDFFTARPKIQVVFGDVIVLKPDGTPLCHRKVALPQPWHVMVSGNLTIFTAATFFRMGLLQEGHWFPAGWRVVADAVWALQLRRQKVLCTTARRFLATFTDTGNNMSLRPNALAEKQRLRLQAPGLIRFTAGLLILSHRIRRWLAGSYRRQNLDYHIWRDGNDLQRKAYAFSAVGPFWPGRF